MVITFEKEYLQELYETGKTRNKKYRFQPEIVQRYTRCVDIMIDVPNTNALFKYNALNYEALKGNKQGIFSIRVNNQYRIEFTVKEVELEITVSVCNIIELSNHYK